MSTMFYFGLCLNIGLWISFLLIFLDKKRLIYFRFSFDDIVNGVVVIVLSSIVSSRLFYLVVEQKVFFLSLFFSYQNWGISLIGGVLGGIVAVYFLYRKDFLNRANFYSLYLPLINGFGRLGCYYAGCCNGLFLGFDLRVILFFYYLFIFLFFYFFKRTLDRINSLFFLYLFFVGFERCIFDYFRIDKEIICNIGFDITRYQLIGFILLILSLVGLRWIYKTKNRIKI